MFVRHALQRIHLGSSQVAIHERTPSLGAKRLIAVHVACIAVRSDHEVARIIPPMRRQAKRITLINAIDVRLVWNTSLFL